MMGNAIGFGEEIKKLCLKTCSVRLLIWSPDQTAVECQLLAALACLREILIHWYSTIMTLYEYLGHPNLVQCGANRLKYSFLRQILNHYSLEVRACSR